MVGCMQESISCVGNRGIATIVPSTDFVFLLGKQCPFQVQYLLISDIYMNVYSTRRLYDTCIPCREQGCYKSAEVSRWIEIEQRMISNINKQRRQNRIRSWLDSPFEDQSQVIGSNSLGKYWKKIQAQTDRFIHMQYLLSK